MCPPHPTLSTGTRRKWNECLCPSPFWALFRRLVFLLGLLGLIPSLSLPLIIEPLSSFSFPDQNAIAVTETISLPGFSSKLSGTPPKPRAPEHHT